MKFVVLSIAFCFFSFGLFAETVSLRGSITYQNTGSKMKALQITARGASPTITRSATNTEGSFILMFPNGKIGDRVTLELGTPLYDVVNDPRELSVTLTDNPNYRIRLVVCKKGERDANAVIYYNISTKYLESNYQKQVKKKEADIAKLKKELAQNGANADELTKQIYQLYAERATLDEKLDIGKRNAFKMAEDFSRIDLAQVDSIYRKAFETYKSGDIDGARQILNGAEAKQQEADLKKLEADIKKSEGQIKEIEDSLQAAKVKITHAKFKRDTLKAYQFGYLAEAQFLSKQFAEAEESAQHFLALQASNSTVQIVLAHALLFQNKDMAAKKMYNDLKIQRNTEGVSFRIILKEDFDALEQAGFDKKQVDKARQWLTE
jgi:hypothetical protein